MELVKTEKTGSRGPYRLQHKRKRRGNDAYLSCRKCEAELTVGENITEFRFNNCDYICRTCKCKTDSDFHLEYKYGVTRDHRDQMMRERGGKCDVCGEHERNVKGVLCIEHCHETEEIRGLVCNECNTTLARLGDNLDGVMKFVNYLKGGDHG